MYSKIYAKVRINKFDTLEQIFQTNLKQKEKFIKKIKHLNELGKIYFQTSPRQNGI